MSPQDVEEYVLMASTPDLESLIYMVECELSRREDDEEEVE